MDRKNNGKRICIGIVCVLWVLMPFTVSAGERGSILLKAVVEDDGVVYKLDNTEFIMYQVGSCKNNSWILTPQFANSGILFDFEDSSAQGTAADKLEKYARDNKLEGKSDTTNMNGEVVFKNLQKGVYLFVQPHKKHIGNRIYQSEPFIVTVPGYYDGQVVWDVIIEPKFKNESIPPIVTKTPPVSEEPVPPPTEGSRKPGAKTGDNTDILRWFLLMGLSAGIIWKYKRKADN